MAIEVQLPDGRILEYPDGTSPDIMRQKTSEFYSKHYGAKNTSTNNVEQKEEGLVSKTIGAIGDLGEGAVSGLSNIGAGLIQRASELGGDATGAIARTVLPLVRPDLAEEFKNITSEDVRKSAGNVGANIEREAQQKGGAFQAGKIAAEIAPLLGVNTGGLLTTGALAGAASGFTKPVQAENKQDSVKQALENTLDDAALGAATGGLIKGVQALPGATKSLLQSSSGINKDALKAFQDAGITPSLAAVSDSGAIKTAQNLLSRFPGSSGVIGKSIEQTKNDIANKLARFGLDKGVTPQQAGEVIETGIKQGLARGKSQADKVYGVFEKYVKPTESFEIANSKAFLDDVGSRSMNPTVLEDLQKRDAFKIVNQMAQSADNGQLNYQDMKYFRNKIGSMLGDKFTVGDQERALLKQAYGSLTQDMRQAAASKGDKALKAFDKSNEFYSKYLTDAENNLAGVLNKNAPEQMFQAIMQGTKIGGTKANSIMGHLNKDQREIVRGSVFQQLGKVGDDFDPVKAITEFNKLSPEAKTALFKGAPEGMVSSYRMLGNAVKRLQNVKEYGNPSGSGHMANLGLFLGGGAFGGAPGLAGALGAAGGANVSARLMTHQPFINWLAQGVRQTKTPEMAAKHFKKLSQIVKVAPELEDDIMHYLGSNTTSAPIGNLAQN